MDEKKHLKCFKCKVLLVEKDVELSYIGQIFHTPLPTCPSCGQIYLSEALVRSRVSEVEAQMEDK